LFSFSLLSFGDVKNLKKKLKNLFWYISK
jgi:hypothetical protein